MRSLRGLSGLLVGVCALLSAAPQRTLAGPVYTFTFTQSGFSQGATVAGSFTGTDIDNDGWLNSFVAGEVTAYSMSFSGNTVVSVFSHGITEIATAGAAGGLVYRLGSPLLLGDDTTSPYEGIASGPLGGGLPPPISQHAYRTGYGPTGFLPQPFGFVEDNSPFGNGSIDHTFAYVVITGVTAVPEPATPLLVGTGLLLMGAARRLRRRPSGTG